MDIRTRKRWMLVLGIFLALAAIRILLIYRSRQDPGETARIQQTGSQLEADAYVVPRRLRAYDLESARAITKEPVWVKEGYKYAYYPYDPKRKRANFDEEAGTLGPIEKLEIKDLVQQLGPPPEAPTATGSKGETIKVRQAPSPYVLAVFEKDGQSFVVPIGRVRGKDYSIYADEIFYIQDPKSLYKHWPAEVWQAIEKHEVKPGMNEIQTTFAVGMGKPEPPGEEPSEKVVRHPNGGNPLVVVYRDGRVQQVKPTS
jgi:hypothetical protein